MANDKLAIEFRGVMMFVLYDDRVEVLIPNCEELATHPDGNPAKKHYAWLTSPKPGTGAAFVLREALIGADLEVGDASDGPPNFAALDYVFAINGIVSRAGGGTPPPPRSNPFSADDRPFVGTRLVLHGGELLAIGTTARCSHTFETGSGPGGGSRTLVSPEAIVWQREMPSGTSIDLTMRLFAGASRRIQLDRSASPIFVWNLDHRTPEQFVVGLSNDELEDSDFRWQYHLFGLSNEAWRSVFPSGLPVPQLVDNAFKTVSGCNCRHCLLDLRTGTP